MLHEWQKNTDKFIPEDLPGYDFICRIPVYIPISEIGLTIWERRVQTLPFIHECLLTSISIATKNISELSSQFGTPENIMLQIISQLDTEQLVAVSAGNIILTAKGREALQAQQKIKIVRKQMSQIFINQVTGEITDTATNSTTYKEPPRGAVYLNEINSVNLDFLRSHFDTLAIIYRENRIEQSAFHSGSTIAADLYRILDISYNFLTYVKDYCFIYLNQEDESLGFQFSSGIQVYEEALREQLNKKENGASNIFSQPLRAGTTEDISSPYQLIKAFASKDEPSTRLAAIEVAYYSDRSLLDGEVEDILSNCSVFKAEKILIEVPYIGEFLNGAVMTSLLANQTKEIIINYSSNDYQANRIIDDLKKRMRGKKDFKLTIHSFKTIDSVKLYFSKVCAISGKYREYETIYRRRLYKLCAEVTFDSKKIGLMWDEYNS